MLRRVLRKSSCIRLLSAPLVESLTSYASASTTFEKPPIPLPLLARSSPLLRWLHSSSTTQANLTYAVSTASDSDYDSSSDSDDNISIQNRRREGVELLRSLNACSFREHLENLSHKQAFIRYDEMVNLAQHKGAAVSQTESRKLCNALISAGVVFRFRDVVYLSTREVAETILASLPDTKAESEKRIEEIKTELEPLKAKKRDYDARFGQYRVWMLSGGLVLLALQFGVFVRLTYWELSWDVMEPIAYFSSLAYGIILYTYFLMTKESFELPTFSRKMAKFFVHKRHVDYDKERYQQLMQDLQRYQKRGMRFRP